MSTEETMQEALRTMGHRMATLEHIVAEMMERHSRVESAFVLRANSDAENVDDRFKNLTALVHGLMRRVDELSEQVTRMDRQSYVHPVTPQDLPKVWLAGPELEKLLDAELPETVQIATNPDMTQRDRLVEFRMIVRVYGTTEHVDNTIKRMEKEVKLQKFDLTYFNGWATGE